MTQTAPETSAAILRRAAELVDQGHIKGMGAANSRGEHVPAVSQEACRFCAVGAVMAATARVYDLDEAPNHSFQVLCQIVQYGEPRGLFKRGDGFMTASRIGYWNDADDRKAEDVSKLLRDVAAFVEKDAASC